MCLLALSTIEINLHMIHSMTHTFYNNRQKKLIKIVKKNTKKKQKTAIKINSLLFFVRLIKIVKICEKMNSHGHDLDEIDKGGEGSHITNTRLIIISNYRGDFLIEIPTQEDHNPN